MITSKIHADRNKCAWERIGYMTSSLGSTSIGVVGSQLVSE